jgi:hypothetical protein
MSSFKVAVLIDGGFLRVIAKKAGKTYDPDFIEKFAHACKAIDETSSASFTTIAPYIQAP